MVACRPVANHLFWARDRKFSKGRDLPGRALAPLRLDLGRPVLARGGEGAPPLRRG